MTRVYCVSFPIIRPYPSIERNRIQSSPSRPHQKKRKEKEKCQIESHIHNTKIYDLNVPWRKSYAVVVVLFEPHPPQGGGGSTSQNGVHSTSSTALYHFVMHPLTRISDSNSFIYSIFSCRFPSLLCFCSLFLTISISFCFFADIVGKHFTGPRGAALSPKGSFQWIVSWKLSTCSCYVCIHTQLQRVLRWDRCQ